MLSNFVDRKADFTDYIDWVLQLPPSKIRFEELKECCSFCKEESQ